MTRARTSSIKNIDALKNTEDENVKDEALETEQITDITETESYDKIIGLVSGCDSLNVRSESNTDCEVVSVLRVDSEIIIDEKESTDDFYKVCTSAGLEGYCMKQYITIK